MKLRKSWSDSAIYILFCVATLGTAWVMRVIITQAIRMAFKQDEGGEYQGAD